ncbi:MAG: ABC transporter ATP-binding protein [Candidatus Aenigmatarchaeota archaeon]
MSKTTQPLVNALKTEWEFLGRRRKLFIFYMSFFIIAGAVSLITPYVIGTIFNDIQRSISTEQELAGLHLKIMLLLLLTVVFWVFHGIARVMEQKTGFFVRKNYVSDKIDKVLELPTKWHKDHHSGDTIDKINRASSALEDFSCHLTFQIVYGLVGFFGSVIIMLFIDWKIGLFALVFSSLIIFIISRIDKNLDRKYQELNRYNNKYSAKVFDYLSNVVTIITLRLKKVVSREIDTRQQASYSTYRKTVVIDELKWATASIAIQVMVVVALIYRSSAELAATGTILIGTLYMLYGYLTQIGETFYKFADLYGTINRSNARIVGAYPLDRAYNQIKTQNASRLPKNWHKISLVDVSFTYDQKGKIKHIDHVNFHFSKGQKIALVGESGSGKSTVLALIRGLYNIERGEVYCNGKLLQGGLMSVRDHVTLIPQEPEIFNTSFRYNITMNLPVKNKDLKSVIEMAQLKSVVEKLPKGLDTSVLEKGVSLSGGEKQRLALARGLLAAQDSEVLLLDEPTSSVDNINEIKIHENIFSKFRQKTIISSVHRLHLLDRFDYIYLFSRGRIIGEGTHDNLKTNPAFRRMLAKYGGEKHRKRLT